MVKVIMGSRGSGKTKKMIDLVNKALTEEIGNVVCMEKGQNMRLNVKPSAKLIDVTEYPAVNGYDTLMAFINGIYAGNYDVTHVFIDSLYKIAACDDADQAGAFLETLEKFSQTTGMKFTIMISADVATAPESISKFF